MSYAERVKDHGNRGGYIEVRNWLYMYDTAKLTTPEDVARADRTAAGDLLRLEALAADLREYRQALAARYAELETMGYKYTLLLERYPHWKGHIEYTVTLRKTMDDGSQIDELREVYGGKDRRKALDRFAELKRQRPGIETVQDIAKKSWER